MSGDTFCQYLVAMAYLELIKRTDIADTSPLTLSHGPGGS